MERLTELTGCAVEVEPDAPCVRFPPVAIRRLRDDFGFRGARVVDALADLVEAYRRCRDGGGSGA